MDGVPAQLSLLGNTVIAAVYVAITVAITVPVVRAGQLRTNRLATATALIFFSCAVGHAFHTLASWQAVLAADQGASAHSVPDDWAWPSALWDVFTAGVGVYYWTLRRGYGVLLGKGALFVDPAQRRLLDEVEARERVAESHRALLAAIVEQSDDAIVGTTPDGIVTAWNSGAEHMVGYSAAEAVGAPIRLFAASAPGVDDARLLARVLAGERGIRYDAQATHKNGSTIDVAVSLSPVYDSAGEVIGVSRVGRDLTATRRAEASQRAAEERAHQAQHMASLGQLAGGVAHDFNNLLGIILNFTAFATEQADDHPGIRDDLAQVRSAAERAVSLSRQLLVFTRQDTVRPELVDINASIAETESMLARTIGEHIELVALPSRDPLTIYADGGHVQQVLVNLAVNARDAMPDGGTLVIEATAVDLPARQPNLRPPPTGGRYVRLLVSDTGRGMPPEVVARIFEPFFTTKPRGQGTGLGLATVYGIIAEAGGSVGVQSEPGVGTTFQTYFPLVEAFAPGSPSGDGLASGEGFAPGSPSGEGFAPGFPSGDGLASGDGFASGGGFASGAARPQAADWPAARGQTVLVVEDEPALGQVIARILTGAGYHTLSATTGTAALALDDEHGCDLLLTDVVMPEMSGHRVAEVLRRRRPHLPVIFMSGYTDGLLDPAQIRDAFIEKPFTAHFLLNQIGNTFNAAKEPA